MKKRYNDLILKKYRNGALDYSQTINYLISLIQSSDNRNKRSQVLNSLEYLNAFNKDLFKFIENLMISDSDSIIRRKAINIIGKYYLNLSLNPIKWAIKYEKDYKCLISLIKTITKIKNRDSKEFLISELREKLKQNIENINNIGIQKYNDAINKLYLRNIIRKFNINQIANILISYITISELIKRYYSVYYELDNKICLPIKLDLSDIEFEVRGWKSEFRNNIKNLSDILGLTYLQSLEVLDLSNNQIRSIRELTNLQNLKYLFLSNNQIENEENIKFFKEMKNLKYLDISGNEIAHFLEANPINNKIEVKSHNFNYFR